MKRLLTALLTLAAPGLLHAQLSVSMKLERTNFVKHESIVAVVSVRNLAGKDVVLGGPGELGWLQIDLQRSDGTTLLPAAGAPKAESTVIKDGKTLTRRINLTNFFLLTDPGTYLVNCQVYFPPLQRWLGAEHKSVFRVSTPRPAFWERTVGVPASHPSAGRYRHYKLFTGKTSTITPGGNSDVQYIYLSLTDEETGDNITTFPLGELLSYRDPQATTDRNGNICVLYMTAPQLFQYMVLDVDGAVIEEKAYKGLPNSSPQLMQSQSGTVAVRGGVLFDRIAESDTQREQKKTLRSLSDRPNP